MPSLSFPSLLPISLLASHTLSQAGPPPPPVCSNPSSTCQAYGVDFHGGGSYFQNTNSPDDFTFVSQFSGCADDIAQNILVDPNGRQYICSNTTLTPDFTNELSTCGEAKSTLFNGEWQILIISNNGGCAPFNAQRAFSITAGPQATVTFTPTVTLTSITTPVITSTTTDTVTSTLTVPPATSSAQAGPPAYPSTYQTTLTMTADTQTITSSSLTVSSYSIVTSTASCVIPSRAAVADPPASIVPTILPEAMQAVISPIIALANDILPRAAAPAPTLGPRLVDSASKAGRKAKRAPDAPTVTVTDTNIAEFVTSTEVVTAPALTTFTEVETTVTITVTAAASASAAVSTSTSWKGVTPFATQTVMDSQVPIVTVGVRPTGAWESCRAEGGHMAQAGL